MNQSLRIVPVTQIFEARFQITDNILLAVSFKAQRSSELQTDLGLRSNSPAGRLLRSWASLSLATLCTGTTFSSFAMWVRARFFLEITLSRRR
jgi:hypothetical protein